MSGGFGVASLADTIVAPATASQPAAIAIVRLSGPEAFALGRQLTEGELPSPYRLARRRLHDGRGGPIDEGMVACMPGPHSYTGEDLLEFHLHGSLAVVRALLVAAERLGARAAQPGEFTRRAVLAGRLSLPKAEGVAALIHAEDERGRRAALRLLEGGLEVALLPAYERLEGLVARERAELDFPDDVSPGDVGLAAHLTALRATLRAVGRQAQRSLASEQSVALIGPPNAGKSTLMNALLGHERVLVDSHPGTTRDTVSAPVALGGLRLLLWDTAGLRREALALEARGIERGQQAAATAALRLWLLGQPITWPPPAVVDQGSLWLIGSQADRASPHLREALEAQAAEAHLPPIHWLSLPSGEGLATLIRRLAAWAVTGADEADETDETGGSGSPSEGGGDRLALTARHSGLLQSAESALGRAAQAVEGGLTSDCVLADLEAALQSLGAVLGYQVDERVFERIFASFCIGK